MRLLALLVLVCGGLLGPVEAASVEGNWEYVKMVAGGQEMVFGRSERTLPTLRGGRWALSIGDQSAGVGSYAFDGKRLTLTHDDGTLYGEFDVRFQAPGLILVGAGGSAGFDIHARRAQR